MNLSLEPEPLKVTAQGLHHYTCTTPRAPDTRKQLCTEMGGSFVGPMPVEDFLATLMPVDPERMLPIPMVDFSQVAAAPSEPKMYGPLVCCVSFYPFSQQRPLIHDTIMQIRAINTHRLCQGVTFTDISRRAQDGTKLKPDIGGFEGNEMQLYIELKSSARQDAFRDSHSPYNRIEKQTDQSTKHRGQIIHYAAEQMAVQHRVSLFTISITGRTARFIRWDRSGAIVTEAFNYVDSPHLLAEFLIRFSRLNAAQRGFDTTVVPADQDEIALLSSALEGHADLFGKHLPTQLEEDQAGQQRAYKIPAVTSNGTSTSLVIGKPFCQPLSPCGRATRGYIAWDLVQGKLVFLKDTWRVVSPGSLSESEAYEHLKGHDVPHLPTIIAAADVMDLTGNPQRTVTQDFADHSWCLPHDSFRLLVHHRVMQELALPLSMVRNSKQLVQAIRNALVGESIKRQFSGECRSHRRLLSTGLAIRCAYKAGNILHRDVSVSNIMLDLHMNGILNDWDHNMTLPAHPDYRPHTYRTVRRYILLVYIRIIIDMIAQGHWQFASISLLGDPHKPHEVHDDIESCVWVLFYFSLHFMSHNSPHFSMTLFDQLEERPCHQCGLVHTYGGSMKTHAVVSFDFKKVAFTCGPLNYLIHELTARLNARLLEKQRHTFSAATGAYERDKSDMDEAQSYIRLFDEALSRDDWLVEDAVEDQLPPKSALQTSQAHEMARSASFSNPHLPFPTKVVPMSQSLSSTIARMVMRSGSLPLGARLTDNVSSTRRKVRPLPNRSSMGPPQLPAILAEHAINASHSSLTAQFVSMDGVTKEACPRNSKRPRNEDEIEEFLPMKQPRTGMHRTNSRPSLTRNTSKSDLCR